MPETPIEPALTAEQWAEPHKCAGRDIVDCDICFGQHSRHARAALCLSGQPFGFTAEDLRLLAWASQGGNPVFDRETAMLRNLAARIAALLPPA